MLEVLTKTDHRGFFHKTLWGIAKGVISTVVPGGSTAIGIGEQIFGGGGGGFTAPSGPGQVPGESKNAAIMRHIGHGHIPGEPLWDISEHPGVSSQAIMDKSFPGSGCMGPNCNGLALSGRGGGQEFISPADRSIGEQGIFLPSRVCVDTFVCPQYADGKKGILWMAPLSGQIVCLPRGVNGKGFGLIRKNKPRAKAYISAAENKMLTKRDSLQNKAKDFAGKAGFTCKKK